MATINIVAGEENSMGVATIVGQQGTNGKIAGIKKEPNFFKCETGNKAGDICLPCVGYHPDDVENEYGGEELMEIDLFDVKEKNCTDSDFYFYENGTISTAGIGITPMSSKNFKKSIWCNIAWV